MRREALVDAATVYGLIIGANKLAVEGCEANALRVLATITQALPAEIAAIKEVLAAEREAADARHLTQRTLAPFFGPKTAEHADTAQNDNHPPSPQQPGPDVA